MHYFKHYIILKQFSKRVYTSELINLVNLNQDQKNSKNKLFENIAKQQIKSLQVLKHIASHLKT